MLKFKDKISAIGYLTIRHYNEAGELIDDRTIKNLVVDTGKAFIASRISGNTVAPMTHMAIGAPSSLSAPLPTDIALTTEIARVAVGIAGGETTGNTVQFVGTFPAGTGTNSNILEAGIFSASSGGTMLSRTTFSAINKAAGDTIVFIWIISIV